MLAVLGIFLIFKTFYKNPEATSVKCQNSEELLQLLNIDFNCKIETLEYEQKEESSKTNIIVKLSFDKKAIANTGFFDNPYEKPDITPDWVSQLKDFGYGVEDIDEMGISWRDFIYDWNYTTYEINWIKLKNISDEFIVYSSIPEILKMDKEGILKN